MNNFVKWCDWSMALSKFSIRVNPRSEWFGLKVWFWSIRTRIQPICTERELKRFSYLFGIIQNGWKQILDWLGIVLIRLDWILIRNFRRMSGLIWIKNFVSDWFGFIGIDFWLFFIKRDTKRFSDWFGMIRISSDTVIEMNRNISNLFGMHFNPILSPG